MRVSVSARCAAAVCFVALLCCSIADAQPPGGGRGGRGGRGGFGRDFGAPQVDRATLLRSDQVKEELQVDDGLSATIEAALTAFREEQGAGGPRDFGALRDMSEDERTAFFEKMQKDREERSRKQDEVLGALLNPEQTKRIDEITLQANLMMGAVATLKSDALKQKLSLSEEQITKLDAVEEAAGAKRMEMFAGLRGGGGPPSPEAREEMRKKGQKLFEQTLKDAVAVLTEAQQKQLDEMKGEAFEIDMATLRGPGRGGFGGGGFGGGGGGFGGGRRGGAGGGGRNRPPADDAN